jgi:hypothetical protein
MKRAVRSLTPPQGFGVDIIDNEHFITVRADENKFMQLFDRDKRLAVEYMVRVKKALESEGAIVLLVRKPL